MSPRRSGRRAFLGAFLGVFLSRHVEGAQHPGLARDLGAAAALKAKSEDWAKRIKGDFPPPARKDSPKFNRAFKKYVDARSAFNGWATEMRARLNADQLRSAAYEESLRKAADLAADFLTYAERIYGDRGAPVIGVVATEIMATLTSAGLKVWEQYRASGARERDTLMNELDRLHWKSFDEL